MVFKTTALPIRLTLHLVDQSRVELLSGDYQSPVLTVEPQVEVGGSGWNCTTGVSYVLDLQSSAFATRLPAQMLLCCFTSRSAPFRGPLIIPPLDARSAARGPHKMTPSLSRPHPSKRFIHRLPPESGYTGHVCANGGI